MIDNLVHIAHNVKIGSSCFIAGQVGIAGSTMIGDNCMIGGQAGVTGHIKIGNNVNIGGHSGILHDLEDGSKVIGFPAKTIKEFFKKKNMIEKKLPSIDKKEIEELLPHREPMLLLDNLYNIIPMKSALGHLKIDSKKFYVQGHFPVNLLCRV